MGQKRAIKVRRRQERRQRKQAKNERARIRRERPLEGTQVIRVGGKPVRYSPELLAALGGAARPAAPPAGPVDALEPGRVIATAEPDELAEMRARAWAATADALAEPEFGYRKGPDGTYDVVFGDDVIGIVGKREGGPAWYAWPPGPFRTVAESVGKSKTRGGAAMMLWRWSRDGAR